MTIDTAPLAAIAPDLVADIRASAKNLDCGQETARRSFPALGAAGQLSLGAPGNHDGRLPEMAEVIRDIARECMSTAFSVWANRMTIEYLLTAGTAYATAAVQPLLAGEVLGVTGMASAFKDASGCGSLELTAVPVEGGYELSGPIRWASNLYEDSLMVTAARTDRGDKIIVALPLKRPGLTVGAHFDLLALGSTASSYLSLQEVFVGAEQVLTDDFTGFLGKVRPTFLVLQTAMCLGLARTCLEQTKLGLTGINSVFTADADMVAGKLALAEAMLSSLATAVGSQRQPSKPELLTLRLSAAELASSAAALEVRTAGGKGYVSCTDASRRYREAAFIPVQSPSESQLRWELGCT